MVGRGLLARPWLAEAYAGDGAMPPDGYARVARLHDQVFTRYAGVLQGVHQLLGPHGYVLGVSVARRGPAVEEAGVEGAVGRGSIPGRCRICGTRWKKTR